MCVNRMSSLRAVRQGPRGPEARVREASGAGAFALHRAGRAAQSARVDGRMALGGGEVRWDAGAQIAKAPGYQARF